MLARERGVLVAVVDIQSGTWKMAREIFEVLQKEISLRRRTVNEINIKALQEVVTDIGAIVNYTSDIRGKTAKIHSLTDKIDEDVDEIRLTLALSVFALIFTLPQFVKDLKPVTSTPTVADALIGIIIVAAIGYTVSSVISSIVKSRSGRFIDIIVFFVISGIALYFLVQYPPDIYGWLIPAILLGLGYGLIIQIVRSRKDAKKEINVHKDQSNQA